MAHSGLTKKWFHLELQNCNAHDMGHVPIDGKNGSLAWLRELDIPQKVYIHINNTNPILLKTSPERKTVNQARIKVGYDGMEILI